MNSILNNEDNSIESTEITKKELVSKHQMKEFNIDPADMIIYGELITPKFEEY